MFKLLALPLTLAAAFLIAAWAEMTPAPQPAGATGFSAERAMDTIRTISAKPHVSGSPEAARVRDWLAGELRKAGLEVEIQHAFAVRQSVKWPGILAAPVDNVIAVLPGKGRTTPAVALMAHYDAVPYSFGASDDGAGTAVTLDTAQQMARGPQPKRDVVFLFTDGEELGLLGATAFFKEHRLAKNVGIVVNVEARGSAGRATMFQTSPGNAGLIRLWAAHAPHPAGSSLTDAIYKLLPNDTDLSVSLDAGIAGINSAFVGGQFDYHNPTDSAANIDRGSLQHLGEFGLSMTQALAFADRLPERGGDSAYFDLFGQTVAHYPLGFGWLLVVGGAALVGLLAIRTKAGGGRILLGLLGAVVIVAGAFGLLFALRAVLHGVGVIGDREMLAELTPLFAIYIAVATGWTLAMATWLSRWRAIGGWGLWIGTMLLALVLSVLLQLYVPGGAYIFEWPLLIAAVLGLVAERRGLDSDTAGWSTALLGGLVFALAAQLARQAYVSLGSETPGLLAIAVLHGLLLLFPLIFAWSGQRRASAAGSLVLLGAATVGSVVVALTSGFSARHPRPGDLFHLTDSTTGTGSWATWSGASELPQGRVMPLDLHPMSRLKWLTTPSSQTTASPLTLTPEPAGADGRETLRIAAPPVIGLRLAIRSSKPLEAPTLNGYPVTLVADDWTALRYGSASPVSLAFSFKRTPGTNVDIRYLAATPGLPAGAPKPGGAPTNWTLLSGSSAVTGYVKLL